MADDISSDEREEIVELASDEDDSPLKAKVLNGGMDDLEKVSSTVRNTSVSTGSEKSGGDVKENGEIGESDEGDDVEDSDESGNESEDESSSGESYSEDSQDSEESDK